MCERLEQEEVKSSSLGNERLFSDKMHEWRFANNRLTIDDILYSELKNVSI